MDRMASSVKVDVSDLVDTSHYHGPTRFDVVFDPVKDLELDVEKMRESIISKEERVKKSKSWIKLLCDECKEVDSAYNGITELVATQQPEENEARFRYQKLEGTVFSRLKPNPCSTLIPILRAGALPIEFHRKYIESLKLTVCPIDGKRLPFKNGRMKLGLRGIRQLVDGQIKDKNVIFYEGCVASGLTIVAALKQMVLLGIKPKSVKIFAFGVTQQGAEAIRNFAKKLEIPFEIQTGVIAYRLNERLYVLRVEKGLEGKYAFGDAGDWSLALPLSYNSKAWWNVGRISS